MVALLCLTLLLWWPSSFIAELSASLSTLGMRGAPGGIELVFHGAVAGVSIAAVRALWIELPSAATLATIALVSSAVATVQSLYWSALPHQTLPGTHLPLAIFAVATAAAWLTYLHWRRRHAA